MLEKVGLKPSSFLRNDHKTLDDWVFLPPFYTSCTWSCLHKFCSCSAAFLQCCCVGHCDHGSWAGGLASMCTLGPVLRREVWAGESWRSNRQLNEDEPDVAGKPLAVAVQAWVSCSSAEKLGPREPLLCGKEDSSASGCLLGMGEDFQTTSCCHLWEGVQGRGSALGRACVGSFLCRWILSTLLHEI